MSYCFDTDILSAVMQREPPLHLVRRLAKLPAPDQFTTSITLGELIYGVIRAGRADLAARVREVVTDAISILPFDVRAANEYGLLRAQLEAAGTPLAEPDMRIGAIARSRGLVLVTGNVRHFGRIPDLRIENWLI